MSLSLSMFLVALQYINTILTVGELKDWTKLYVWSKATLITGDVGGSVVDPPS